jgi:hypothetical protein
LLVLYEIVKRRYVRILLKDGGLYTNTDR